MIENCINILYTVPKLLLSFVIRQHYFCQYFYHWLLLLNVCSTFPIRPDHEECFWQKRLWTLKMLHEWQKCSGTNSCISCSLPDSSHTPGKGHCGPFLRTAAPSDSHRGPSWPIMWHPRHLLAVVNISEWLSFTLSIQSLSPELGSTNVSLWRQALYCP